MEQQSIRPNKVICECLLNIFSTGMAPCQQRRYLI